MSDTNLQNNIAEDIAALKQQFEQIRTETENFLVSAKSLSDKGANEAQDLLAAAKTNWQSIVSSFESSSIAKFFSQGKKPAAKKSAPKAKAKSAAKPAAKKAAAKPKAKAKVSTKPAAKKSKAKKK